MIDAFSLFATQLAAGLIDLNIFPDYLFCLAGVEGELVLLILLGHVERGLVDEGLIVLQGLEIPSRILDDVVWLVTQYLPCEIFENCGEVLRNRVFLYISASHQLQYYYLMKKRADPQP